MARGCCAKPCQDVWQGNRIHVSRRHFPFWELSAVASDSHVELTKLTPAVPSSTLFYQISIRLWGPYLQGSHQPCNLSYDLPYCFDGGTLGPFLLGPSESIEPNSEQRPKHANNGTYILLVCHIAVLITLSRTTTSPVTTNNIP